MNTNTINIGDTLKCVETGREFIAAKDGCSFNYARTGDGDTISDEGVLIQMLRELRDRSRPFVCYLSSDGQRVTTWKGARLGTVTHSSTSRTGWHGSTLTHIRVTDEHGGHWYGKGAGCCMVITLRPCKGG